MNIIYKSFVIFILFFTLLVFNKTILIAGTVPEEVKEIQEQIYYTVTPKTPNPGDDVKIEAEMYGTEIKNTSFEWKIDGKIFKKEVGLNKINFTLNNKTKIDLKITTRGGLEINKVFEFDPKKIILIWEAKTYTPPFYKGKSLYSNESSLVLNAINLDQKNPLTNTYNNYVWSVDDKIEGNYSGVGYSSFVYQGNILRKEPLFKVNISSINSFQDKSENKEYTNETSIRIQSFKTDIISYEKSPILGVLFNKTIEDVYHLNKSESTVVSYPMYYSLLSTLSGIYSWYINDNKINTNTNQLSFKKKNNNEESRLTVKIENEESLLQTQKKTYIINTNN